MLSQRWLDMQAGETSLMVRLPEQLHISNTTSTVGPGESRPGSIRCFTVPLLLHETAFQTALSQALGLSQVRT